MSFLTEKMRRYIQHPKSPEFRLSQTERRYRAKEKLRGLASELSDISDLIAFFPANEAGEILTEESEMKAQSLVNQIQQLRIRWANIKELEEKLESLRTSDAK